MIRKYIVIILLLFIVFMTNNIVYSTQTVREAAALTRQIVKDAGVGTFLTKMQEPMLAEGYPFGIMEYYSEGCTDQQQSGDLLLYMSDLQMSVRNMKHDPDHAAFTIRALKLYDNPKMGNGSSLVESPRFTLFGAIELLPKSKVYVV
ncbi:hypothetical protein BDA99DRAFT_348087 [Phascolomyces articulosus]|uniref:CREG-like beta-barrel domain-containing protein n=1 Tax=Phascolomyces articulosus TaxID=60185 RepID=A0AAD5K546_9FUNG|nr:hypothetical protein BDA99DRAFT_348087 [Phascolomyces articulosus]